jgi:hypothetical protein
MPRLLDPSGTLAIILGAHDWTKAGLPIAPSFRRSAAQFHRYLLNPFPHGLDLEPDFVLNLFDDPAPAGAQLARIRDTIRSLVRERGNEDRPVRDILIYYVGHGASEERGHLHLLVRDTSEGIEAQSSIATPDLAQVLRVAAPQQRRLIVLDCCFSEAAAEAFGAMGALDEAVAGTALKDLAPAPLPPERGTLLLCSSPRRRISIGRPNDERTLFTGAMLSVLAEGAESVRSEMLSFFELREAIYDRMLREHGSPPRPALHQPEQQTGDLTRQPAFPNVSTFRQAAEKRRAEQTAREVGEQRKAEQAGRLAKGKADETAQLEEEKLRAEEAARGAEVRRKADDVARQAEEKRQADEAMRLADENRKAKEAALLAEEQRQADETAQQREADEATRRSASERSVLREQPVSEIFRHDPPQPDEPECLVEDPSAVQIVQARTEPPRYPSNEALAQRYGSIAWLARRPLLAWVISLAVTAGIFLWASISLNNLSDGALSHMISAPLSHIPQLARSVPARPPLPPSTPTGQR